MKIFILLLAAILILNPDMALAGYLDPGSGSTLAQIMVAAIAGISRFFRKIFSWVKK